jgi:hypothetical protein
MTRNNADTININLDEFELDVEVEYEVLDYDRGDRTTPPSGGGIEVHRIWLGIGDKRIDILPAFDSLSLGIEDSVMESLDLEDLEQELDADHAYELARDREMGL